MRALAFALAFAALPAAAQVSVARPAAPAPLELAVELGYRQSIVPWKSYDLVSQDDVLPAFHLALARDLGRVEARLAWDAAGTTAPLFDGDASLAVHEVTAGARWRWRRGRVFEPFAGAQLGVGFAHLSIVAGGVDHAGWGFAPLASALGGLELMIPPEVFGSAPLTYGLALSLGWTQALAPSFETAVTSTAKKALPSSGADVGRISLSGPTGELALSARW